MAKVNEFETAHYDYSESAKQRFSSEANMHYRFSSAEKLIENTDDLLKIIKHHEQNQCPRLKELQDYYKGINTSILIGKRRKEEHLSDHRATHNFAKYVSQFIQGYMVGVPLKTSYPNEKINEQIRDINRENDADEHNSEIVLDQSIYGRAYELLYRNKKDQTRFTTLDVLETFVIYDETVERSPIAGVRYFSPQFKNDEIIVYVYTDDSIYEYESNSSFSDLKLVDEKSHHFEGVPIVEYENNKYRQGDFEDVLNLIDLYDAAQSDTANFITDTNDAYLVMKGNLDIDVEEARRMKENNIIMLRTEPTTEGRSSDADAFYIYKQYDVAGIESYKTRIFDNILLFTSIPNLLDSKFSGNQSGEAIKMKLFGLEQKRATKERLFKKSLRDRYRLINNIMKIASEGGFDVNDISIMFTENLPKAIDQELKWFADMGGELSQETLLSQLSFVENPQEELDKIRNENPQNKVVNYTFPKKEEGEKDGEVS